MANEELKGPKQRPCKGKRKLACVGIKYLGGKYVTEMAKRKHPGFDMYIVPGIYTGPHAGNKVAYVKSAQLMTAFHEVGHLLGLGHAGRYTVGKHGNLGFNSYGDTASVMSSRLSKFVTAPQYYHQGWLEPDEIAHFDREGGPQEFPAMRKITEFRDKGLATITIPPRGPGGRWGFLSISRAGAVNVHLALGGGSQKVAELEKDEYADERFLDIRIKVLGRSPTKLVIETIPEEAKTLAFADDDIEECQIDEPLDDDEAEAEEEPEMAEA
jgi:hypothetical protein